MPDVFISYKRERRAAAGHLADTIGLFGYDCWFDGALIEGRDFTGQLERKLRESKALVVLWCSLSVGSRWVHEEVDLAHSLGILVPTKIEPCELPVGNRLLHTVDLTKWDGSPRAVEIDALIDAIARQVGREASLDYAAMRQHDHLWRRYGAPSMMSFALAPFSMTGRDTDTAPDRDIGVLHDIWDDLKTSTSLERLRVFWEQVRNTPVQLLVEERIEHLERAADAGSAGWLKEARPFLSAIRQLYGNMGWSQSGPKPDGRDFGGELRGLIRALPEIGEEVSMEAASEPLREYIATTLHHGLPIPDDYRIEPIIPPGMVRPGLAVSYYHREGFGELFEEVQFGPTDPRGYRHGVLLQPETRP
jgi:hypothetical protein